jgi:thiamine pyrophosphokinase
LLGIIFTGGQGPEPETLKQRLGIIAKDTLFVAADSGLILAEEAGFRVDWIIGDMDSLGDDDRLRVYPSDCVIRHKHDKDYTDTELAMQIAVEKGCNEIWIIGGSGSRRIDHLFAIRSMFEREVFPCRWITEAADIRCINAAVPAINLSCRMEKNASLSVFPLGAGPWEAVSSGLKWPLAGLPWDSGFFSLNNVAEDGDFSIEAVKGRFMVTMEVIWQQ